MTTRRARRPRRSKPASDTIYLIRLRGRGGAADIHALRRLLKTLLRQHRLVCTSAREEGAS